MGRPTHNLRFEGTQLGWIGLISVPITSHPGNSSAKSLLTSEYSLIQSDGALSVKFTYMAQIPGKEKWLENVLKTIETDRYS